MGTIFVSHKNTYGGLIHAGPKNGSMVHRFDHKISAPTDRPHLRVAAHRVFEVIGPQVLRVRPDLGAEPGHPRRKMADSRGWFGLFCLGGLGDPPKKCAARRLFPVDHTTKKTGGNGRNPFSKVVPTHKKEKKKRVAMWVGLLEDPSGGIVPVFKCSRASRKTGIQKRGATPRRRGRLEVAATLLPIRPSAT